MNSPSHTTRTNPNTRIPIIVAFVTVAVLGVILYLVIRPSTGRDQGRDLGHEAGTGVRAGYDATKDALK